MQGYDHYGNDFARSQYALTAAACANLCCGTAACQAFRLPLRRRAVLLPQERLSALHREREILHGSPPRSAHDHAIAQPHVRVLLGDRGRDGAHPPGLRPLRRGLRAVTSAEHRRRVLESVLFHAGMHRVDVGSAGREQRVARLPLARPPVLLLEERRGAGAHRQLGVFDGRARAAVGVRA